MLKYFNCPDGETRKAFIDCLECPRRPEGRCLSLRALKEIAQTREWTGVPSCTQCINPTRMEYLKITNDYAVDPKEQVYLLDGTRRHDLLDKAAEDIEAVKSEIKLKGHITTGIADAIETDELKPGYWKLTDNKTWASFSVAKWLDEKNRMGDQARAELELQLGNYRILTEALGYPISKLQVEITVRDGGTQSAYKNGIDWKIGIFPVKMLDAEFVLDYFYHKAKALKDAVVQYKLPPLCPYEERWSGRRCKNYCDVAAFCPEGRKVNKL